MSRIIPLSLLLALLVGCQSAEGKRREAAYVDACLQGNQGACQVLATHGRGDPAAMRNFVTATDNAARWAVDQQNTGTYSGGYRSYYPRY